MGHTSHLLIFILAFTCATYPKEGRGDEAYRAVMMIDEEAPDSDRAVIAVQGALVDLPVELNVEHIPGGVSDLRQLGQSALDAAAKHDARTVFWVDITDPTRVFLYISSAEGGRTLIRNIDSPTESRDARFDAMAIIVRSALRALSEGGEIGVVPPPAPEPAPQPELPVVEEEIVTESATPPEVAPRQPLVGVSAAYGLAMHSSEVPAIHGPRLAISPHLGGGAWFFLAYRVQLPFRAGNELLSLEIFPHPVEVGIAFEWSFDPFLLRAGACFLLDWVTWKVTTRDDQVFERKDELNFRIAASPFVALAWQPHEAFHLYLSAALDVFIYQKVFYFKENAEAKKLIDPWTVSPFFQLGATFRLLGKAEGS